METLKEQILKLRSEGKSYREIKEITGASKGTIAYHCNDRVKQKTLDRTKKHRAAHSLNSKLERFKQKKNVQNKIQDFQRREGSKLKNSGKYIFKLKDIINKFGENPVCYLTGEQIDLNNPSSYSLDHFIPATKGGDNSLENLRICSAKANKMKSDLLYEEFIELCSKIIRHTGGENPIQTDGRIQHPT